MTSRRDDIVITLDVDWASDEVIRVVASQIEAAGVCATFFATHECQALRELDRDQFEIGLHPSFDMDPEAGTLAELRTSYADAIGGRSHGLVVSSRLLATYEDFGLRYESNILLPYHEGLHAVRRRDELVSIPFMWSDDLPLAGTNFDVRSMALESPGLKVVNFHPIHVFMNTAGHEHYASFKAQTRNLSGLEGHVNRTSPGIGTLFADLLEQIGAHGPGRRMKDVHDEYVAR